MLLGGRIWAVCVWNSQITYNIAPIGQLETGYKALNSFNFQWLQGKPIYHSTACGSELMWKDCSAILKDSAKSWSCKGVENFLMLKICTWLPPNFFPLISHNWAVLIFAQRKLNNIASVLLMVWRPISETAKILGKMINILIAGHKNPYFSRLPWHLLGFKFEISVVMCKIMEFLVWVASLWAGWITLWILESLSS